MTPTPETLRELAEQWKWKVYPTLHEKLRAAAAAWEEANALLLGAALKYVELQEQLAASEQARQAVEKLRPEARRLIRILDDAVPNPGWRARFLVLLAALAQTKA